MLSEAVYFMMGVMFSLVFVVALLAILMWGGGQK